MTIHGKILGLFFVVGLMIIISLDAVGIKNINGGDLLAPPELLLGIGIVAILTNQRTILDKLKKD